MRIGPCLTLALLVAASVSGCQFYGPDGHTASGEMALTIGGDLPTVHSVTIYVWPHCAAGDGASPNAQICDEGITLDCGSGSALELWHDWLSMYSHLLRLPPERQLWPLAQAVRVTDLEPGTWVVIAVGEDEQNQPIAAGCLLFEIEGGDRNQVSIALSD